jgi:hypothetical protein
MAEITDGVLVTEEMLTEAARAGDLESLTVWARQGVRVTTAYPLYVAIQCGFLDVLRCLVTKLGAEVNQATPNGKTPLMAAARSASLAVVQCLVELGAEVGAVDIYGDTVLLESALNGHFRIMQYLLEEGGANMDDVNNICETIWDLLIVHFEEGERWDKMKVDALGFYGLLRVLVLRGPPPPALVALLSPEPARVVQEGARLRARLPAYLVWRRALLDAHCPVLLPPLRALVHGYMELITTEDLWATGLGQAP